jgi:1,4-alpha-glucan branching enzyme
MHDTLLYMARDPVHRRYHHDNLTFGLLYAFSENFVLPLSHDEVVHGKCSLLGKMSGDRWQKFANLRLYFAFLYSQPGKKLLFMGGEFAQRSEWNHDRGLEWGLLSEPEHVGVRSLVIVLNRLYRACPALHELDCEEAGFEWIDCQDSDQSVITYLRFSSGRRRHIVVACNFTPVVHYGYRVGVPSAGAYREMLNTDSELFGGTGVGNLGRAVSEAKPWHGRAHSLLLTLPPLAAVMLEPEIDPGE